jgi:hypothetical protein
MDVERDEGEISEAFATEDSLLEEHVISDWPGPHGQRIKPGVYATL